ncbi:9047_t:CDS:2 [Rhizophagus irregularis]|nr:9047_t:CDS:2 [Rhizophagus irregularis]
MLPELCLRIIFEELKNDFISLHSCILVNKNWCTLALPKLWKNPFDDINNSNINGIMEANIPLLNTYTSCLSEDIKNNLAFQKLESILISATYVNFEIMEILCCQAKDCLRVLKLPAGTTDFPKLENICVNFCPNIKKFITSIKKSSYKHIISVINACKNLEEIHIYEDQCDEIFTYNVLDANQFLRLLGEILPKSVHTFKYLSDLSFDSTSLETFLRQFQPKKFILLEFNDCSFFSDEHLSVIISLCGKTLKKLHIIGKNNLHHMYVHERKHQFLGDLYIEKLNRKGLFIDNLKKGTKL